jgi:hypothetical protein
MDTATNTVWRVTPWDKGKLLYNPCYADCVSDGHCPCQRC